MVSCSCLLGPFCRRWVSLTSFIKSLSLENLPAHDGPTVASSRPAIQSKPSVQGAGGGDERLPLMAHRGYNDSTPTTTDPSTEYQLREVLGKGSFGESRLAAAGVKLTSTAYFSRRCCLQGVGSFMEGSIRASEY